MRYHGGGKGIHYSLCYVILSALFFKKKKKKKGEKGGNMGRKVEPLGEIRSHHDPLIDYFTIRPSLGGRGKKKKGGWGAVCLDLNAPPFL